MTNNNKLVADRDQVLDAFLLENERGKATLERYLRSYPEHALALIDLSRELGRAERVDEAPLTPAEQSRVDAAWIMHKAARPSAVDPLTSMTQQQSKAIASNLGVPRQVVLCFRERKVVPASVPRGILAKFASGLGVTLAQLKASLAIEAPALARSFKADSKPGSQGRVSFEQILIDAGVSEDQRAHLLADES